MKRHAKIVIVVAVITLLLTTVSALALNAGQYLNPLSKNQNGFIFNGAHSNYNVASSNYGNPIGYVPPSAPPTPVPTPTPAVTYAPVTTAPNSAIASAYESFAGTIKEVNPFYENEQAVAGKFFVLVENAEGGVMNFIVDSATINVTRQVLQVGSTFTGFYKANQPMIMIYPPQVYANVAVIDLEDGLTVKVDYFDLDLVSKDGTLKLTPDSNSVLVLADGTTIDVKNIGNRDLVAVYGASTRSIPAQTTPVAVIVLN